MKVAGSGMSAKTRKRYTVEVSRVDAGSFTAGFNSRGEALGCAKLAVFALGDIPATRDIENVFAGLGPKCQCVTYQPFLKPYTVSIRRH